MDSRRRTGKNQIARRHLPREKSRLIDWRSLLLPAVSVERVSLMLDASSRLEEFPLAWRWGSTYCDGQDTMTTSSRKWPALWNIARPMPSIARISSTPDRQSVAKSEDVHLLSLSACPLHLFIEPIRT